MGILDTILNHENESALQARFIRERHRAGLYWTDYRMKAPANRMTRSLFTYLWLNRFFPAFQIAQLLGMTQRTLEKRLKTARSLENQCEYTQRFFDRNCKKGV